MRRIPTILVILVGLAVSAFLLWVMAQSPVEGQELRSVTYYEQVWQGDTFWVAQHDFADTAINPTGREMLAEPVQECYWRGWMTNGHPLPYLAIFPNIRSISTPCVN